MVVDQVMVYQELLEQLTVAVAEAQQGGAAAASDSATVAAAEGG